MYEFQTLTVVLLVLIPKPLGHLVSKSNNIFIYTLQLFYSLAISVKESHNILEGNDNSGVEAKNMLVVASAFAIIVVWFCVGLTIELLR